MSESKYMSVAGLGCRVVITFVASLAVAVFSSGCSTVPVRVMTDPANAIVTIKKDNGAVIASKVSPAQAELSFRNETEACIIEAIPSPEDQDRYMPMKHQYTKADIEALPKVDKNFHLLKLALSEKEHVRVITEPTNAIVTFKTDNGTILSSKASPAEAELPFRDGSELYTIEVIPSPNDQDRYLPMKNQYTKAAIQALPQADRKVHVLRLALTEKEFINLTYLEVVLDPVLGWRGLVTQRRAYQNVTEQGGRAPQLVVELKERLAVRGMAISPNSQRIVYSVATARDMPDFAAALKSGEKQLVRLEQSNLRAVNLQAGGIEQITQENFLDLDPTFSPDGRFLLMASNRRLPAQTDILRISSTARTGGIQDLYVDNRNSTICKPGQAANGLIAFNLFPSGWQDLREAQIWTIGGPDGYPTQVALGTQPALSPDGKRIAYIQAGNLWVCNADGSGATQLTTDAAEITAAYEASLEPTEREVFQYERTRFFSPYSYPGWSPDGKFLVYTSMKSADPTGRPNEDIWVMSTDGTKREQLTTNFSADRWPLVSPDGKSIYFLSNRGKQWAIWRIPAPSIMNGE